MRQGHFGIHAGLCRIRISLFSSLSAATAFMIARPGPGPEMFPLVLGIFLLACGSSALNQYQERALDAIMPRTMTRPIPSGKIGARNAFFFSLTLISSGSIILLLTGSIGAPVLGLMGVLWYNGLYTALKRKTPFASVPGAVVGAITPAVGWAASQGDLTDPRLITLCFFFFMWQVPHFWLLLLDHGEEYEKAGLPSLTRIFTKAQFSRIIVVWILSAAASSLLLSMSGMVRAPLTSFFLLGASLWLTAHGMMLLRRREGTSAFPLAFRRINIYLFIVMTLLGVDKILL